MKESIPLPPEYELTMIKIVNKVFPHIKYALQRLPEKEVLWVDFKAFYPTDTEQRNPISLTRRNEKGDFSLVYSSQNQSLIIASFWRTAYLSFHYSRDGQFWANEDAEKIETPLPDGASFEIIASAMYVYLQEL